jgi:hypothetical protein
VGQGSLQQAAHPLDLGSLNLQIRDLPEHSLGGRLVNQNLGIGNRHPFTRSTCGEQHRGS